MVVVTILGMSVCLAFGWGRTAHRAAAEIAEARLTRASRAAIDAIIGPGVRLADISTWADEQREVKDSAHWHFVNVPLSAEGYHRRFCPARGCVVDRIEFFRQVLRDPKSDRPQKQQAIKFLIHLIADLHQPLHVGDKGDRGGNLLQVRFFTEGSNLHRVWDSQMIDRYSTNVGLWVWDLDFVAKPAMVAEWSKGSPEEWATESLKLARQVYRLSGNGEEIQPGARLGRDYFRFAMPLLRVQLAKAGVRTAFVLNELFRNP